MRTRVRTALALFFGLATFSLTASAAKWGMEPSLSISAGYNNNVGLRSSNIEGVAEGRFVASTTFRANTPKSGVTGDVSIDLRRYNKVSNFDRNNIRAGLNSFYNFERSSIGLNGSFVRDSTLDSQLDETNIGFVDLNRHDRLAGAFWRLNFGARTNATINYSYRDVKYEDSVGSGFVNFNTNSGSLAINRQVSPRATITGSGTYSLTENDNDITTKSASLSAGGSYNFDSTLSASVSLGQRRTTVDSIGGTQVPITFDNRIVTFIIVPQDITNESKGTTYSIQVTKTFERGSSSLSANRGISTSAGGIPSETTSLVWTTNYGITTTISADVTLRGNQSVTENVLGNSSTNKSFYTNSSVNWDITESLQISAIYQFRVHTYDSGADDATRNAAYLTLRYQ